MHRTGTTVPPIAVYPYVITRYQPTTIIFNGLIQEKCKKAKT
jgi:hypothetical protein